MVIGAVCIQHADAWGRSGGGGGGGGGGGKSGGGGGGKMKSA